MAGSVTTTNLSLLEIGSQQNYVDEGTLYVASGSTIENDGVIDASAAGAGIAGRVGTAVGSIFTGAGTIAGAFSFQSNSANSMVLVLRSGLTVYQWWNTHAETGA